MSIKVTVCQLNDDPQVLTQDWERLVEHVKGESSQVVLLPEMPFHAWVAGARPFKAALWQEAIQAHDIWQKRLSELAPALVLSTRPINRQFDRLNEGFFWTQAQGYNAVHHKYYLPEEEGFWEASWYQRGERKFVPAKINGLKLGFLICTELWFMERARAYGKAGTHLLVTPRASQKATVDKWLLGGRSAAIVSGAFSLSSNRVSGSGQPDDFGGQGWIIGPEGQVLGVTSPEQPFSTIEIDLREAEIAKKTYPRYVQD
ncbi:MAG: carbon-nitrogen hydrolase family protein [Anaerolineaceae bacterium]|nr:carbon-nitrogen hydrolase family protein [Anaerolineaceae bacterium]